MKLYRFFLPLLVSSPAFAASITDLTVRGLITPTACTPGLSSSGLVDYGKISQQDLKPDRGTRLPIKQLLVTVNCEGLSRFALRMRDNRDGTANVNSEIYYGLGLDGSGNRIGVYSLSFDPKLTDVDALPVVYGTESTTGGLGWRTANTNPIDIGARSYLGFTDTEGSTAGPTAIRNLSSTVNIQTVISAKQNLDLSRDVLIDGSATMEVIYL
ncbi:DUF1120 domain-containing protein [Pseudomonas fluorescens group sp.]|uniref:Exported protein n=2 Tax=Pseudomonas fluorescens TaxID=294 RepID=C3K4P0_PSEFS|nr:MULTISPECIES: DUF1120 domain-containing protein [Pseudomonas fluorescens group]MBZ6458501.1 DUF1120 domain-containing protein [Pseudomonas fluorescens group sp.]MBZ6464230.1 DUF1120 domain-containing protein [Pseudomonas fluorescens group sp.]MBZ6467995.1 DUF1120 domain-containing protein [Pseudomonas fluorescens group sp.]WQD73328.1 DUF1120 domain-containing protein [Pseudomonas marginalis]CAI2795312.1 Putative exported protein [Pseudomonas fluorescens SBW25]